MTNDCFRQARLLAALTVSGWAISSGLLASAADPQLPPVLLQVIRDDAIHDELGLSAIARRRVLAALPDIDARWFRVRNLAPEKQSAELDALTSEMTAKLSQILEAKQLTRLSQLQRQALGTRMVLRADVIEGLRLTKTQQETLTELFIQTDRDAAAIQKQVFDGAVAQDAAEEQISKLKTEEKQGMIAALTNQQKSKISSLTGSSFDFSRIKRMYPLAPELSSNGVTWIQGGPLAIQSLRGKVVAVHFYAFQCINCQRNLPHYKAWHDDYADDGLVIIGIQTPETSAERSLEKVTAAANRDGIEYPVMLDGQSSNWTAWNNTMWPTVYLIDKQGFLRRWWQGEMNWNGTPGEKQMRQSIEQLLAEER